MIVFNVRNIAIFAESIYLAIVKIRGYDGCLVLIYVVAE